MNDYRPLGAFYRNSWAPPRRGLRREVTQCFTVGFGALDGRARNLGWSRNSAAECFHDGSGRPENLRALLTPLPYLRPRAPQDTHAGFRRWRHIGRVSKNGGWRSRRGGIAGDGLWLTHACHGRGARGSGPPLAAKRKGVRAFRYRAGGVLSRI